MTDTKDLDGNKEVADKLSITNQQIASMLEKNQDIASELRMTDVKQFDALMRWNMAMVLLNLIMVINMIFLTTAVFKFVTFYFTHS